MKRIDFEMPFGAKDSELIGATYTIPEGFHAVIEGNKVIMKKGEKPSTWTAEDDKIKDAVIKYVSACEWRKVYGVLRNDMLAWLKKQGEQKSEWSEEDEAMIITIINRLELGKVTAQEVPYIDRCVSWLKFLKERVQLQPKQEWGADDEIMMDIILNDINYAQKNFSDSKLTSYDKKVEWLKSHIHGYGK